MNKKSLQQVKGITLIALIITIIVIIIIAGLTAYVTMGDNGLIERIRQAQRDFEEGKAEEQAKIQETKDKLNLLTNNVEAGKTATDGNSKYTDSNGKNAVVPKGFTVSGKEGENTIENGLVIYDTRGYEVTDWDTVDNSIFDQWVWIPVSNISSIYEENLSGVDLLGGTGVKTKYYSKSSTLGNRTLDRVSPQYEAGWKEPEIIVGDGTGYDAERYQTAGFSSLENMANFFVKDYKDMIDSIKRYGGFYIGRYELTGSIENPTERASRVIDNTNWHNLYKACKNLGKNNSNIETRMMWDILWDKTCQFINTKGDKVDLDDSRTYGNYDNSTGDAAEGCGLSNYNGYTGRNEAWKVNNIYDFAGNCAEMTQGASSTSGRTYRGVHFVGDGITYSVNYRNSFYADQSYSSFSTRPVMYVNATAASSLVDLKSSGNYVEKKTDVYDSNGNKVVIPKGFKVASDSGINVTEGIVIEDDDIIEGIGNNRGNQYVWVPVGNGIQKNDGTSVDITCGRYTFASDGTETLQQDIANYANIVTIEDYFQELNISREGTNKTSGDESTDVNTTALSLANFYNSVKTNGGYYIARYEASYGIDGKPNSKISDSFTTVKNEEPSSEGQLWGNIRQVIAAQVSRTIYSGNNNYNITSDLVNSYAWDTAIVYIQKFSGDTNYSRQNSINTQGEGIKNTGTVGDEKCKINDISSNLYEWSTEYSTQMTSSGFACPCAIRGGLYYYNTFDACHRAYVQVSYVDQDYCFRTILY